MEKQEWMEQIEQEFNLQTSEQLNYLVNQCHYELRYNERILDIVNTIKETKNISFRQWKALKAQLNKHYKDCNPIKSL